jgi:hypothetical protein
VTIPANDIYSTVSCDNFSGPIKGGDPAMGVYSEDAYVEFFKHGPQLLIKNHLVFCGSLFGHDFTSPLFASVSSADA